MRWPMGWLGIGASLRHSVCAHTAPMDGPVVDQVLRDHALREQLVAHRAFQDWITRAVAWAAGHAVSRYPLTARRT